MCACVIVHFLVKIYHFVSFFVQLKKFRHFLFCFRIFLSLISWNRKNGVCVAFYFLRLPFSLKSNVFFPESNSMRNAINYIKSLNLIGIFETKRNLTILSPPPQPAINQNKNKIKTPDWKKSGFRVRFVCFFIRSFVCSVKFVAQMNSIRIEIWPLCVRPEWIDGQVVCVSITSRLDYKYFVFVSFIFSTGPPNIKTRKIDLTILMNECNIRFDWFLRLLCERNGEKNERKKREWNEINWCEFFPCWT